MTSTNLDLEHAYIDGLVAVPGPGHTQGDWMQYWDDLAVPPGNYADRAFLWLESLGHTEGSLQDRWAKYWANPGTTFTAVSAVVEDASPTIITVTFSASGTSADFTDGVTVSLDLNNNPVISAGAGPGITIAYTVTTPVVAGQSVVWTYDGLGDIAATDGGSPLAAKALLVLNNVVSATPADAVVAQLSNLSPTEEQVVRDFVNGQVSVGNWALVEEFQCYALNQLDSLKGWLGVADATLSGPFTHSTDGYAKTDGLGTTYIDTGFTPSTDYAQATITDFRIGMYLQAAPDTGAALVALFGDDDTDLVFDGSIDGGTFEVQSVKNNLADAYQSDLHEHNLYSLFLTSLNTSRMQRNRILDGTVGAGGNVAFSADNYFVGATNVAGVPISGDWLAGTTFTLFFTMKETGFDYDTWIDGLIGLLQGLGVNDLPLVRSAEAAEVINRLSSLSPSQESAVANFVDNQVNFGNWDLVDEVQCYSLGAVDSLRGWKGVSDATIVGDMVRVPGFGWRKASGDENYIDTGFSPSVDTVASALDSVTEGIYLAEHEEWAGVHVGLFGSSDVAGPNTGLKLDGIGSNNTLEFNGYGPNFASTQNYISAAGLQNHTYSVCVGGVSDVQLLVDAASDGQIGTGGVGPLTFNTRYVGAFHDGPNSDMPSFGAYVATFGFWYSAKSALFNLSGWTEGIRTLMSQLGNFNAIRSTEAQAVIDLMPTALGENERDAISAFVNTQVASGNWASLEEFQVYGLADPANALIGWKGVADGALLGVVTHTVDGYQKDATAGSINTNIVPGDWAGATNVDNIQGSYVSQNDAWTLNSVALFGIRDASRLYVFLADALDKGHVRILNAAGANTVATNYGKAAGSVSNRLISGGTAGGFTAVWDQDVQDPMDSQEAPGPDALPVIPVYVGTRNNLGTPEFGEYGATFACFYAAQASTFDITNFWENLAPLLTALGVANVPVLASEEGQAVVDLMPDILSATEEQAIRDFVDSQVAVGNWDLLEEFQCFAFASQNNALKGWKARSDGALVGDVVHNTQGFTKNGVGAAVDTGVIPADWAVALAADYITGSYVHDNSNWGANEPTLLGVRNPLGQSVDAQIWFRLHNATPGAGESFALDANSAETVALTYGPVLDGMANHLHSTGINSFGNSAIWLDADLDAMQADLAAGSGALPNTSIFVGAVNEDGGPRFSDWIATFCCFYVAKSSTFNMQEFKSNLDDLLISLGVTNVGGPPIPPPPTGTTDWEVFRDDRTLPAIPTADTFANVSTFAAMDAAIDAARIDTGNVGLITLTGNITGAGSQQPFYNILPNTTVIVDFNGFEIDNAGSRMGLTFDGSMSSWNVGDDNSRIISVSTASDQTTVVFLNLPSGLAVGDWLKVFTPRIDSTDDWRFGSNIWSRKPTLNRIGQTLQVAAIDGVTVTLTDYIRDPIGQFPVVATNGVLWGSKYLCEGVSSQGSLFLVDPKFVDTSYYNNINVQALVYYHIIRLRVESSHDPSGFPSKIQMQGIRGKAYDPVLDNTFTQPFTTNYTFQAMQGGSQNMVCNTDAFAEPFNMRGYTNYGDSSSFDASTSDNDQDMARKAGTANMWGVNKGLIQDAEGNNATSGHSASIGSAFKDIVIVGPEDQNKGITSRSTSGQKFNDNIVSGLRWADTDDISGTLFQFYNESGESFYDTGIKGGNSRGEDNGCFGFLIFDCQIEWTRALFMELSGGWRGPISFGEDNLIHMRKSGEMFRFRPGFSPHKDVNAVLPDPRPGWNVAGNSTYFMYNASSPRLGRMYHGCQSAWDGPTIDLSGRTSGSVALMDLDSGTTLTGFANIINPNGLTVTPFEGNGDGSGFSIIDIT